MPFDTAQVPPESRPRDRLARRSSAFGGLPPRPLVLNLRADIGVRVAKSARSEPRTDEAACLRSMDRTTGRT
jgi:hypothetical protein